MRLLPVVLVAAALCLAACQKEAENEVSQEALDQIAQTVEDELNAAPTAILALLRTAAEESQVGADSLVVGFEGTNYPVDWWLYRRGYVQLFGRLSIGRPAMGVTEKGRAEVAKGDAVWFAVDVGEPDRIDCATPDAVAVAGCEVELPVTPTLTDAGRAAIGEAALAPFNVVALVAPGEESGWTVNDFRTEGPIPADIALNAILGPEAARESARAAAMAEIESRLEMTPEGQRQAAQRQSGYVPPPPIEDQAPVTAVDGGRPLGLDLPRRGGLP